MDKPDVTHAASKPSTDKQDASNGVSQPVDNTVLSATDGRPKRAPRPTHKLLQKMRESPAGSSSNGDRGSIPVEDAARKAPNASATGVPSIRLSETPVSTSSAIVPRKRTRGDNQAQYLGDVSAAKKVKSKKSPSDPAPPTVEFDDISEEVEMRLKAKEFMRNNGNVSTAENKRKREVEEENSAGMTAMAAPIIMDETKVRAKRSKKAPAAAAAAAGDETKAKASEAEGAKEGPAEKARPSRAKKEKEAKPEAMAELKQQQKKNAAGADAEKEGGSEKERAKPKKTKAAAAAAAALEDDTNNPVQGAAADEMKNTSSNTTNDKKKKTKKDDGVTATKNKKRTAADSELSSARIPAASADAGAEAGAGAAADTNANGPSGKANSSVAGAPPIVGAEADAVEEGGAAKRRRKNKA